ncbi:MAG: DMT family transporter [Hyphomicrobiaceae bacterium]|nr:DMT family transporter [Hyphomicrobiaceae bacterium]
MQRRRDLLGLGLGFIGVVIFGATLPVTKLALRQLDPAFVTVGRAALASIAAMAVLVALRRRFPRQHLKLLAGISLSITVGFPGFMALALQTVPAGHGGVVLGILPLATALAAALFAGEKPSLAFWSWAALGAAVVIGFTIHENGGYSVALGDVFLLAAGASASTGYALSGKLARSMPGWEVVSWALVVAAPVMIPLSLILASRIDGPVAADVWGAFVYLALFSQFIGFFFWNAGLAIGGVARVGQVQLLQTFVTLAIAAVLLGEPVGLVAVAVAMVVGLIVVAGRRAKVEHR